MIEYYVLYEYHVMVDQFSGEWSIGFRTFGTFAEAKSFSASIKRKKTEYRNVIGPLVIASK